MPRSELLRWGDIDVGVSEPQLRATLTIKSEGLMKTLMVKYMGDSRNSLRAREIRRLLDYLEGDLAKSAQDQSICKVSLFPNSHKLQNETSARFG